jgi:hypothetical protein
VAHGGMPEKLAELHREGQAYIAKAREIAERNGGDPSGWPETVLKDYNEQVAEGRREADRDPRSQGLSGGHRLFRDAVEQRHWSYGTHQGVTFSSVASATRSASGTAQPGSLGKP